MTRLVFAWSLAMLGAVAVVGCSSSHEKPRTTGSARSPSRPTRLEARGLGRLPAPVQLPAVTSAPGGRALVLGGLSSIDSSLSTIVGVDGDRARVLGDLPQPLHDAAAATVGGAAYFFGGGGTAGSSADIVRVDPDGHTSPAGRLPAAASDIEAATIGGTAYVVAGYTGSVSLRSIVAFRPGESPRLAATLPVALRYAAVAAVAGRVTLTPDRPADGPAWEAGARWRIPTTSTSRRAGAMPSWWPSDSGDSTSATRTRCACTIRSPCRVPASTTWTSPPTSATCSPRASSAAA